MIATFRGESQVWLDGFGGKEEGDILDTWNSQRRTNYLAYYVIFSIRCFLAFVLLVVTRRDSRDFGEGH